MKTKKWPKTTLQIECRRGCPTEQTVLVLALHATDLAQALRSLDLHLLRRLVDGADLPREARDELERARLLLRQELGHLADLVLG
jgi:hypothetical protein